MCGTLQCPTFKLTFLMTFAISSPGNLYSIDGIPIPNYLPFKCKTLEIVTSNWTNFEQANGIHVDTFTRQIK